MSGDPGAGDPSGGGLGVPERFHGWWRATGRGNRAGNVGSDGPWRPSCSGWTGSGAGRRRATARGAGRGPGRGLATEPLLFAEQERAPRGWDRGLHPGLGRPGWCRAGMCSARRGRVIGGGDKSCTDRPFPRTAERGYLKECVGTLGGDRHVKPTIPGFGTAVARLRPADWQNSLPSDCDWLIGANVADHGRPGHPPQPSSDPAGQGSSSRGVLPVRGCSAWTRERSGGFAGRQRSPR